MNAKVLAAAIVAISIGLMGVASQSMARGGVAQGAEEPASVVDAEAVASPAVVGEGRPEFSPEGEALVGRMAQGFLSAVHREVGQWWECARPTPKDQEAARADRIAREVLAAVREYDAEWLSPWGIMGTIWLESRGDPCAIGPHSRRAAYDLGLVPEGRAWNRWTAQDVKDLMQHPRWKKARGSIGADLGMGQQVWRRWARIFDDRGTVWCGGGQRCRVPTLDEMLSYGDGARVVVTGMVHRHVVFTSNRPWVHWPGAVQSTTYGMRVARVAQAMGGDVRELAVW